MLQSLKRAWTVAIVFLQAVGALPVLTFRKTKRRTPDSPPSDGDGSSTAGIEQFVFRQFDETARLRAQGAVLRAIAAALLAGACSPEGKSKQEYQYPSARRMTRCGAIGLVADGETKQVLLSWP